ncbi:MAG TPA: RNA polymerase sigma-G factor [Clostridiales bacterium]|nr:RNA polymerase sigma-G factor [Clostridiales bacterium]
MLDHEQTMRLIKEAQQGDEKAKSTLLAENMPLIKSIIRRYRNTVIEYDDLIQLGSLGLYKAMMNFNPTFGVRFSTYAVPMINGEIKRQIRDDGPVKVSRSTKTLALMINKYTDTFRSENGRDPTVDEIAAQFKIDAYEVVFTMDSTHMPVSLYEKYDDDSGGYLIDNIKTVDKTDDLIDHIMLNDLIKSLDDRDKKIILLRYYRDKTQSEVAEILGVSQVQVSRLESKILSFLKTKLTS